MTRYVLEGICQAGLNFGATIDPVNYRYPVKGICQSGINFGANIVPAFCVRYVLEDLAEVGTEFDAEAILGVFFDLTETAAVGSSFGATMSNLVAYPLCRPPVMSLTYWDDNGYQKQFRGQTFYRGETIYLHLTATSDYPEMFSKITFTAKKSVTDNNSKAVVHKNNLDTEGSIVIESIKPVLGRNGMTNQLDASIFISAGDTSSLTSKTVLQWECQLDDLLGSSQSLYGTFTIVPDVYHHSV